MENADRFMVLADEKMDYADTIMLLADRKMDYADEKMLFFKKVSAPVFNRAILINAHRINTLQSPDVHGRFAWNRI